jgi:hypothetical protein
MKKRLLSLFVLLTALSTALNSRALAHTDVTAQEAKNMIDSNDKLIVVDV